jgi:predicted nucleotidyltransferase component of viral defense system
MLNFDDILGRYPQRLRAFKENLLKEYLQYRILDIIYGSPYSGHLVFLGGTAIRIVHQGVRFSEDLDFDNRGLDEKKFEDIAAIVQRELSLDGYTVTIKNVVKGAYHCYISFPGLLFEQGMSGHKEERILIQIDAEPQQYAYSPDKFLINQFGIFRYINTVPVPLLLSQKILACLNRKREKGRDFFDVVFLMAKASPDYGYLKERAGIIAKEDLVGALKARITGINMKALANDVEPFLFDPAQKDRVALFEQWLETV